jgi:hypothetical protein
VPLIFPVEQLKEYITKELLPIFSYWKAFSFSRTFRDVVIAV